MTGKVAGNKLDVELFPVENYVFTSKYSFRSASLPRNYGRNGPGEKVSMMAAMMRTSVGNAGTMTRPSNLALRKTNWKSKVSFRIFPTVTFLLVDIARTSSFMHVDLFDEVLHCIPSQFALLLVLMLLFYRSAL